MRTERDNETLKSLQDYRNIIFAIRIRQKKMAKLIQAAAPAQKLTTSYEIHEGSYQPKRFEAIDALEAIAHNKQLIDSGFDRLEQVENALAFLEEEERLFLVMYYVDAMSVSYIASALNYASRQSIYNLRERAVTKFSQIMGCDCRGLDKT